jgi:hypothetical protein
MKLSIIAEGYAQRRYAEYHYAECRNIIPLLSAYNPFMHSVIMLSVVAPLLCIEGPLFCKKS